MIRGWLLTVTCAACISSIAMAITPEGRVKNAVRLSCGLLMMAALMSITANIDEFVQPFDFSGYRERAGNEIDTILSGLCDTEKESIERSAAAYILEKASARGLEVTVSVTAEIDGSGCFLPSAAVITGQVPEDAKEELSEIIETDLGITKEKQKWSTDNG